MMDGSAGMAPTRFLWKYGGKSVSVCWRLVPIICHFATFLYGRSRIKCEIFRDEALCPVDKAKFRLPPFTSLIPRYNRRDHFF